MEDDSVVPGKKRPLVPPRRVFRELITEEAEPGEDQVYEVASELIVDWREAWAARRSSRYNVDWLRVERRRSDLELRLIGVFALTPPPPDAPCRKRRRDREPGWRGLARAGAVAATLADSTDVVSALAAVGLDPEPVGSSEGFLTERNGGRCAAWSEWTIRRTLAGRHLSRKMTEALLYERDRRRAEQPEQSVDSEEQPQRGPQETAGPTIEELTQRIAEQERELKEWIECTDDLLEQIEDDIRTLERRLGFRRGSSGQLVSDCESSPRTHPALVTAEPLPDDGVVFGEALPVVAEWRRAQRALEKPPHTPGWLGATERLLMLEVQLIDDRRLTLPPDGSPWDDVRRDTELQLRQHRLKELRRQRLWTEPSHWAARVVTLGRFGREEELGRQMQREFEERRAELLSSSGERRDVQSRN